MNIQIFGTTKCFDTKKAQRYFKERGIKFQMIDLKEWRRKNFLTVLWNRWTFTSRSSQMADS